MAGRRDIEFSYSLTDRVVRLGLGELADFSGAKYDGDFSLSLEQAQRRKHEYVAESIGLEPGRRVLDLGCGWGALLNYIRNVGARGVGVTLSSAQVNSCHRNDLDVHLYDARAVTRETRGCPLARSRSSAARSRTSAWSPLSVVDSITSRRSTSGTSGPRR